MRKFSFRFEVSLSAKLTPFQGLRMSLKIEFGRLVRLHRKHAELTQLELAVAIGVSERSIRNIENGIYAPEFPHIEAIAQTLKVSVRDLFPE